MDIKESCKNNKCQPPYDCIVRCRMCKRTIYTVGDLKLFMDGFDKMKEFVEDCSVSHNETRYKYKALIILNKVKNL